MALLAFAVSALALLGAPMLHGQAIWNGGDGDFHDPNQWSPATVPSALEPVFFKVGDPGTVSFAQSAHSGMVHLQNGKVTFDLGTQTWTSSGSIFRVGDSDRAAWNSDAILSGGTLNVEGYIQAGVFANDDGHLLTLTNGHAMTMNLSSTANSVIGRAGSNTTLKVEGGSILQVLGLVMATNAGSTGNSVVVDGAGSTIRINEAGASGSGELKIGSNFAGSDNNTLTVQNGASVAHKTGNLIVGTSSGTDRLGSGNRLIVTGAGAAFNSDTALLTVRGGTGAGALGNSVEVTDGGTLELTASGANLEIRHENTLLVDGGTINLNSGELKMVNTGSLLDFNSGTINTQAASSSATARTVIGDGAGASAEATYHAVAGGSTHNFFVGGGLLVETDGAMTGTGLFIGDMEVSGRLAPGTDAAIGTLSLQEDLVLNASAVTRIKINGLDPGASDRIEQFGASSARLGGTLLLEFSDDFDAVGSATLLDFDSLTGAFADVQISGLVDGLTAHFESQTGQVHVESQLDGPLSTREASRMVTAEMRRTARTNVARYDWAQDRVTLLRDRLADYLAAEDDFLWDMLPAQSMPRILYSAIDALNHTAIPAQQRLEDPFLWPMTPILPVYEAPPGSEGSHFAVPRAVSRGFGRKWHYHIDPFNHPWKVQSRGSGQWYPSNDLAAYYASALDANGVFQPDGGDPLFLQPSEPGGTVDDGTGHPTGDTLHVFAAHYAFRVWQEVTHAIQDLAELYTLTGDPVAAHKAGVLLLRAAEVYPAMFYDGDPRDPNALRTGGIQDYIWETWTAEYLSLGYDRIFDALSKNPELGRFLARRQGIEGAAYTPRQVAAFIEDRLLRDFAQRLQDRRIIGNPGMPQLAMTSVAIGLDDPAVSPGLIDWLFQPDGGAIPGVLIDAMSRDGLGIEAGLGYASIPPLSFFRVQQLLATYVGDASEDLIERFPKFANALSAGEAIRVHRGSFLSTGDAGRPLAYGEWGVPRPVEMALEAYRRDRDAASLRELYFATRGNPIRLPRDIFADDPEGELADVAEQLLAMAKPGPLPSYNAGGYGQAVLQGGSTNHPVSFALNYGPMSWGHGHGDRLGLHVFAREAALTADLGYPTFTGPHPERIGWSSHSASHNTLTVDDESIPFGGASSNFSGKTRLFAAAGPVQIADIDSASEHTLRGLGHNRYQSEATRPYEQATTFRRAVIMVDAGEGQTYGIDLFWVRGGGTHRLTQNGGAAQTSSDWPDWQPQATGTALGPDTEFGVEAEPFDWLNAGTGLSFLDQVERAQPLPDRPFWVEWPVRPPGSPEADPSGPAVLRVHDLTGGLDATLTARGQSPSEGPDLRYWLRERRGENLESQFVSILEPYGAAPFIESVRQVPVLQSQTSQAGFATALEVQMIDGRVDRILVTENGGLVTTRDGFTLDGRLGWARFDATGGFVQASLIEADFFELPDRRIENPGPRALTGSIIAIETDPAHRVRLQLSQTELPESIVGKTIIVDNHTRSDASYRIEAVLGDGWIDIGRAAIEERHLDPDDYSKSLEYTIRQGESFRIALTTQLPEPTDPQLVDSDGDGIPDAWELQYSPVLSVLGSANGSTEPADFDGDGHSDFEEWLAGTDPTNPGSYFAAWFAPDTFNGLTLQWQSITDRSYTVRESLNLSDWIPISGPIEGTGRVLSYPVEPADNSQAFWQIKVTADP